MRGTAEAFDLRAALQAELAAAQDALALSDTAQAVHRCRVCVKRARALARVGAIGAPGLAGLFNDAARALMADLSAARDVAALRDCAKAEARKAGPQAAVALERTAKSLARQMESAPLPDGEAVAAQLRDLVALANVWPEPSPAQVARGVKRVIKRARKAFKRARGSAKAARRHRWRKREKDRLYAAQLTGAAWPEKVKRRRGRAQTLTRALGGERDLLLLIERLEREPALAGGGKAAAVALGALITVRNRRAKKADRLGAKVHRRGA